MSHRYSVAIVYGVPRRQERQESNTSIKFLLLSLLLPAPRYGYELKGRFDDLLGGTWPLNPGQVYSTLSRLEADGWVTSETVPQALVPDRRVYTITEDGRQELKQWMSEAVEGPVRLRDEMFGKVLSSIFAGEGDPLAFVWAQRRSHLQTLADLRRRKADPDVHPATTLVLEGAILRTEADLRWLDLCEEQLREGNRK